MADENLRRRWSDADDDSPFENRALFRPRRPDESDTDYNLARVDAKVELSLRRSHQLHSALSALYAHEQVLRLTLVGDPRIPNSTGAIGALTDQVSVLQAAQVSLPAQVSAAIRSAAQEHDAEQFRSLKKWVLGTVGAVIASLAAAVLVILLSAH